MGGARTPPGIGADGLCRRHGWAITPSAPGPASDDKRRSPSGPAGGCCHARPAHRGSRSPFGVQSPACNTTGTSSSLPDRQMCRVTRSPTW